MKKEVKSFIVNTGLLVFGIFSVFSGMLIQLQYHVRNHDNDVLFVLGYSYSAWSNIHKLSILFFTIFSVFHVCLHFKWYKIVISKRLLSKNLQVIFLSIIFILVGITGFIPWFIDLLEGDQIIRKTFIEIHDKIAIVISVLIILHLIKRKNWFFTAYRKMTEN